MNINDLKVVLGADGIYRRSFQVLFDHINKIYTIMVEEHVNGTNWHQQTYRIYEADIISKVATFNVRACLFFSAAKKSSEAQTSIYVYSGEVVGL